MTTALPVHYERREAPGIAASARGQLTGAGSADTERLYGRAYRARSANTG
jgi:hypothetical protein